ncbi:glycoside hydrolase family 13 protein [Bifidobacterium gallicum]|uniref:Alpha-amylase n=1 Tax=Bifidobacterium gallicum DSM 20093 = LMG 11596 TaxID=561180 RepID=A0A087AMZ4_9BIFI|nr:alpha-glucosidase [Bifidobacterium gallicum]KFI60144.1 alpha-amylase [Bifidobacterium gallicum DSM 20093 = LMG 11596]
MTSFNRKDLPDVIRTNGARPNPWWANAVVYQIYPRSFQDSNNDGIGDIKGITSRLDYLADLGVDVVWLSPVYVSPQDDNGYDIADYQAIDPMFGTMDDMDELLAQAHARGIKVIMDLVVNHTSDEHAWFQASRSKDDPHADWYWWRPARPGFEPGTPGAEPNQWGSYFGGSAWQYDPKRGEYFLHQYSPKQPDLNWENPAVRQAVYRMMNWWMDRGIDGFRMDVITQISKVTDESGRLPGEPGSHVEDGPVNEEGYTSAFEFCSDGPRLDEFLEEMRREVFEGREGYLNVGEAPGVHAERNGQITDPGRRELDMLFQFDHLGIDQVGPKWVTKPFSVRALREQMRRQQEAVAERGWTSCFTCNHDQPRVASRWGDESARSAKAFGLLTHLHRGTPYIYEGEELGMTNAHFTSLDQYRDLESINAFRQRVEEAQVQSAESMMDGIALMGRDNARTPMQWDDSRYAGFMDADSSAQPWLAVNSNHDRINAAAQVHDDDSVFSFYKKLIELRHDNPVVAAGSWRLVDDDDASVYAFVRELGVDRLLTVVNLTDQPARVPSSTLQLISDQFEDAAAIKQAVVLSTTTPAGSASGLADGMLEPWEGVLLHL